MDVVAPPELQVKRQEADSASVPAAAVVLVYLITVPLA